MRKNFVQFESVWVDRPDGFYLREDQPALACTTTPFSELRTTELAHAVHASLQILTEREKETILRHHEGESYGQIANTYGLSRQRVYELCTTARKKLKKALKNLKP